MFEGAWQWVPSQYMYLWTTPSRDTLGVSGLLLRAIRSLYNHSESLVCISNNMSDSFPGERQSAHSGQGELLPHMEEFTYSEEKETDLYSDGNDADTAPICSFMSSL